MSCPVSRESPAEAASRTALDHGFRIECLEQVMRDIATQFDQISREMVDLRKIIAMDQETLKITVHNVAKLIGLDPTEITRRYLEKDQDLFDPKGKTWAERWRAAADPKTKYT